MAKTLTLRDLPNELHLRILTFLRYQSILSLRLTSHHFHDLITASDLAVHREAEKPLISIDETKKRDELGSDYCETRSSYCEVGKPDHGPLPCYICLRWLPETSFSYYMSHAHHSLGQRGMQERICIQCGTQLGFYPKGGSVGNRVVCLECCKPFPGHDIRLEGKRWMWARLCNDCAPLDNSEHERIWKRYRMEKQLKNYWQGMRKGKEYRDRKGEMLRSERGIYTRRDEEEDDDEDRDPSLAINALLAQYFTLSDFYVSIASARESVPDERSPCGKKQQNLRETALMRRPSGVEGSSLLDNIRHGLSRLRRKVLNFFQLLQDSRRRT